jgi:hypothetical protein
MARTSITTSQGPLVLVVQEVCAGKHGAGRARKGGMRAQEGLVGDPAPIPPWGISQSQAGAITRPVRPGAVGNEHGEEKRDGIGYRDRFMAHPC